MRSTLRVKRGMKEHCREFNTRSFLTEDEWKLIRLFEATLRETSRLTTICQNEDKLNTTCRPVMRKASHDGLNRKTMTLIDVEDWSIHNLMMRPMRS